MTSTTQARTTGLRAALAADLPASLVVFLVALPLCMGIALASGAPIMSGLIAGIVGGIVVGGIGGAPLLVSGPAAGLAVMVYGYIQDLGFAVTCAAVVVAGLIQMALGRFKVARAAMGISPAVIHGMLAGIGVLIVLGQLHIVLGGASRSSAFENVRALPQAIANLNPAAAALGLGTIVLLLGWQGLPLKRLKRVPGALVAVVGGTALAVLFKLPADRVQLSGDLFQSIALPQLPEAGALFAFIGAALALALVASAESLLSAVATDKLHAGARANLDRELFAQGAANTLSGLLGGLPITGVIVRSAANIDAGARSRWSAVLHGVWMLLFVTLLGFTLTMVPLAVLAGLLVHVGAKLVQPAHLRELARRGELSIYLVTLFGVVGVNLLAGIAMGFGLALLKLVWRLARVRVAIAPQGEARQVTITGSLTFLGVPRVSAALEKVPAGSTVELELAIEALDHAGFETLESFANAHQRTGGRVVMEPLEELWARRGANPQPPRAARQLKSFDTQTTGGAA